MRTGSFRSMSYHADDIVDMVMIICMPVVHVYRRAYRHLCGQCYHNFAAGNTPCPADTLVLGIERAWRGPTTSTQVDSSRVDGESTFRYCEALLPPSTDILQTLQDDLLGTDTAKIRFSRSVDHQKYIGTLSLGMPAFTSADIGEDLSIKGDAVTVSGRPRYVK